MTESALPSPGERCDECNGELTDGGVGVGKFCRYCDLRAANAELRARNEAMAGLPVGVQLALTVLLNHVEPGWENCKAVVSEWLDAALKERTK